MTLGIQRSSFVRIAAFVAALLMISLLVMSGSRAAFTAQTNNPGNTFAAANGVTLTDDAVSTMFVVTGMTPGEIVDNCIEVTFIGAGPGDIRIFSGTSIPGVLADVLNVEIAIGDGGGFVATELGGGEGDCTGFTPGATVYSGTLSDFVTTQTDWAGAALAWDTSVQGNVQTYQVKVTMDGAADNSYALTTAGPVEFVWEARG